MAYLARVSYTGNGSTTQYSLPFSYIATTHIKAYLDNVETALFSVSGSTLTFNSAPANAVAILIKRVTPTDARLVDFQDGSVLTESDLDKSADQNFYVVQEQSDNVQSKMGLDASSLWDADNKRIINVANPTGDQDAATKHYLENTWLTTADKANITTLAAITDLGTLASNNTNVNTVAGDIANVNTVAGANTNVGLVATNIASVNTVATNITKVVAVADDLAEAVSEVVTVADDLNEATSEIDTVAQNITNVNTVGTNIANVNLVGGSISNVNTVASNLASVNSFAEVYRISSSAPVSSLNVGDLYFDTTANELKVYKSSGWAAAGSTVNGTSARFNYTATADQTTFTGADTNGETLAYDAGFADVYLNGVRLSGADITITSGTSVVLATGAAAGDILDVVAYGTFSVASIAASAITSGTIGIDRIPSITNAKLAGSITEDKLAGSISNAKLSNSSITINGSAVALGGSVTVGETKPTISSLTPSTISNAAENVVIAGGNFVAVPRVHAIDTATGIWYEASSVTFTSGSSITANFTLAVDSDNYRVRVENPDGNSVISAVDALTVSDAPSWTTSAGSLGTVAGNFSGTVATVAASSDSAITYSEVSDPLVLTNSSEANCSLNSSTGVITTTDFGADDTSATLFTFTIRATDAESQTTDRTFTLTSSYVIEGSGGFN